MEGIILISLIPYINMMLMIAYMYKGPQGTENSYGKFGSLVKYYYYYNYDYIMIIFYYFYH